MLVVIGGLAEIAAGSISMGLGGYLAAKSLADTYHRELAEFDCSGRLYYRPRGRGVCRDSTLPSPSSSLAQDTGLSRR